MDDTRDVRREAAAILTTWISVRESEPGRGAHRDLRTQWLVDAANVLAWPLGPADYHAGHRRALAHILSRWADDRDTEDAGNAIVDAGRADRTRFLRSTAALILGNARPDVATTDDSALPSFSDLIGASVLSDDELLAMNRDREYTYDDVLEIGRVALWLHGGHDFPTHAHVTEAIDRFHTGSRAPSGVSIDEAPHDLT